MKLNELPKISGPSSATFLQEMTKVFRETAQKVNQVASGTMAGFDGQTTAVPAAGTWAKGDIVRNSAPIEAGSAASKYVIYGWFRLTDGSANVLNTDWVEMRFLTGN